MKPATFEQANGTLTGGPIENYGPDITAAGRGRRVEDLPVRRGDGTVISCWRASWLERLAVLLWGRVWLRVAAAETHPPIAVQGISPWGRTAAKEAEL